MIMTKYLRPTLREKKRYILFETKRDEKYIKKILLEFLGEYGYGKAGIIFVKPNIIRVSTKWKDQTITALGLIKDLKILKISGILNKVFK